MSRKRQRRAGRPSLELIEEATHLLRLAPLSTVLAYFVGAGPFVLGLLYFWSDMSRGAFADQRVLGASLGMAVLFVWMRTWQTVFMVRLRAQITGREDARWTLRRWGHAALMNTVIQSTAFVTMPVAMVLALPAPWTFAFYQNCVLQADNPTAGVRDTTGRAWRLARLWTEQSINVLLLTKLFALFVFFNVLTLIVLVPQLLKTFFGIESVFSMSLWSLLNTTVILAALAVTYLLIDPLLRAIYVLRCHYGDSLQSGEDLLRDLRVMTGALVANTARAASLLLLAALCLAASPAQGAATPQTPSAAVAPEELDRAIDDVLDRAEFNWRLPRERSPEKDSDADESWFRKQVQALMQLVEDGFKWFGKQLQKFAQWLDKFFRPQSSTGSGFNFDPFAWLTSLQTLVWVLLAVILGVILFLLFRAWQRRRPQSVLMATAVTAMPDLRDESVGADQLPEDGWLQMAREQLAAGDLRLALRALYLASLAHLAQRDLVKLEKFKSNRDYEREVLRRARALPEVREAFSENVGAFDRAWYGLHEVTRDGVGRFERNLERIRTC